MFDEYGHSPLQFRSSYEHGFEWIFHATVAKFGDPCRKSIPCAILIDTFDTGSRPPSSICQVRVVGGRYGQIDCKGEMIEDASACDHYDHGFYHILPLNSRWVSLSIE